MCTYIVSVVKKIVSAERPSPKYFRLGLRDWSIVEFPAGDGLPTNAFKICLACAADHMPIPKCKMIKAKEKKADEGNK